MREKSKRKIKEAESDAGTASEPLPSKGRFKRLGIGLTVTVVLMAATMAAEHTHWGSKGEKWAFEWFQELLSEFDRDLPVKVIDTSTIPSGKYGQTSRSELLQAIEAVVAQHPAAVGVDIDVSPEGDHYVDDNDPQFFDRVLELKRKSKVPIFLGVFRSLGSDRTRWLGHPKYAELAAALIGADEIRQPIWVRGQQSEEMPTLGTAVASNYEPSMGELAAFFRPIIALFTINPRRGIEQQPNGQMSVGVSLINYSKLDQLETNSLDGADVKSITDASQKLENKMVFLGNVKSGTYADPFNVPDYPQPKPGVLVLACVAYTLGAQPRYELKLLSQIALDLLVSIVVLLLAEHAHSLYVNKVEGPRFFNKVNLIIWGTVIGVIVLGVLMNSWANILWLDFPLVIGALFLHPKVEKFLKEATTKGKKQKRQRVKQ
jgi:CHASE2 domain-containing sensor protein